jgi:hypothetical protein
VVQTTRSDDLLTLIGRAIAHLRSSIDLFETEDRCAGLKKLATVISEIDAYLHHVDSDPLLRLASLPATRIEEGLLAVSADLSSVLQQFDTHES